MFPRHVPRALLAASALALATLAASGTVLVAAPPRPARARPAAAPEEDVTGQLTIRERDGEPTSDLALAVVYLEPRARVRKDTTDAAPSKLRVTLHDRQFVPRVRAAEVGDVIEFPNDDPFRHNVFSNASGNTFDLGLYGKGGKEAATFRKPGLVPVFCNIHPRMTGFVMVVNTPWVTQPRDDGRFTLRDVPPGRYKLRVWHERGGTQEQDVTVGAGGLRDVAVSLDARGYRFVQHKNKFGQEYSAARERY